MKTGDKWGSVGEKCGKFGDLKSKGLGNMILNCNLKMLWGIFRFYYVGIIKGYERGRSDVVKGRF